MKIYFYKKFEKKFKKLSAKEKEKVNRRITLFAKNMFSAALNNHALKGRFFGCRTINITGNLRAVYKKVGRDAYLFIDLGTHSNLY